MTNRTIIYYLGHRIDVEYIIKSSSHIEITEINFEDAFTQHLFDVIPQDSRIKLEQIIETKVLNTIKE